jgi:hypothetical protein
MNTAATKTASWFHLLHFFGLNVEFTFRIDVFPGPVPMLAVIEKEEKEETPIELGIECGFCHKPYPVGLPEQATGWVAMNYADSKPSLIACCQAHMEALILY